MADDSCSPPKPAVAAPSQAGGHTVMCVKFGRKMEGLDRAPWKGELGQRIYENVSKEAWKLWIEHSKMIMNEYRLNPLDPQSQKIMEEQTRAILLWRRSQAPGRLRSAASQRLTARLQSLASLPHQHSSNARKTFQRLPKATGRRV